MQRGITFKRVGPDDAVEVLQILQQSPEYYKRVAGIDQITLETALHDLTDTPPSLSDTYEKISLLVFNGKDAIGFIDLHKDHPQANITYVGLLLVIEGAHKQGLGRATYHALEQWIKTHVNCRKLRLGVSTDNPVKGFWCKMGFSRNGRIYTWTGEKKENLVHELEKEL